MKKIIALVLVLTLSLFAFAACGGKDKGDDTPAEKTYYLSLAVEGAGDASLSYGTYEVAPHVAAVVTDADGKIVAVRFDCAQTKFQFNEDGSLVAIDRVTTKVELKEAYGEMPAGTWYVQAQGYCTTAVGRTLADLANLDGANTEALTAAGCTMKNVAGYKAVLNNAGKYAR
jgi:hypothetical protein